MGPGRQLAASCWTHVNRRVTRGISMTSLGETNAECARPKVCDWQNAGCQHSDQNDNLVWHSHLVLYRLLPCILGTALQQNRKPSSCIKTLLSIEPRGNPY